MVELSKLPWGEILSGNDDMVREIHGLCALYQEYPGERPRSLVPSWEIQELLEYVKAAPPGCFVEVGVFRGGTAWYLSQIAQKQQRALYLYDTFKGIPYKDEERDIVEVGAMSWAPDLLEQVKELLGPYPTIVQGV